MHSRPGANQQPTAPSRIQVVNPTQADMDSVGRLLRKGGVEAAAPHQDVRTGRPMAPVDIDTQSPPPYQEVARMPQASHQPPPQTIHQPAPPPTPRPLPATLAPVFHADFAEVRASEPANPYEMQLATAATGGGMGGADVISDDRVARAARRRHQALAACQTPCARGKSGEEDAWCFMDPDNVAILRSEGAPLQYSYGDSAHSHPFVENVHGDFGRRCVPSLEAGDSRLVDMSKDAMIWASQARATARGAAIDGEQPPKFILMTKYGLSAALADAFVRSPHISDADAFVTAGIIGEFTRYVRSRGYTPESALTDKATVRAWLARQNRFTVAAPSLLADNETNVRAAMTFMKGALAPPRSAYAQPLSASEELQKSEDDAKLITAYLNELRAAKADPDPSERSRKLAKLGMIANQMEEKLSNLRATNARRISRAHT